MNYLHLAIFASIILIAVLMLFRNKTLTVQESFAFFFLLQYGPHSLLPNTFSEFADKLSDQTEQRFLLGMFIAYTCLAVTISGVSFLRKLYPPNNEYVLDLRAPSPGIPLALCLLYTAAFAALQGGTLEITREYIKGFLGSSAFEFSELRRELYADSPYVRVASLTRQTATALLFSWLVTFFKPLRPASLIYVCAASLLFVVCAMQMNKFPFAYFLTLTAITMSSQNPMVYGSAKPRNAKWLLPTAALACVILLTVLYRIQYRDSGVSEDRLNRVIIYRIFFCASDTLRLWFDYFPEAHPFAGYRGIPVLASLAGASPVHPTILVPEHYVPNTLTTFQTGFIGAGQATAGYLGIAMYASFVGIFVSATAWLQIQDRGNTQWQPFWNVLMLNMLFFSTRELHTAMLSGGTISVLILLISLRRLPRISL